MSLTSLLLDDLDAHLRATGLGAWCPHVPEACAQALAPARHGRIATWDDALAALPTARPSRLVLDRDAVTIGAASDLAPGVGQTLTNALQALHPWRKGPFDLFGITVDAEWRSDQKWARVAGAGLDLVGARVLDVGCGNGYYAWRMLGAGATSVLGVDPGLGHLAQFAALRHFAPEAPVRLLPLAFEALPTTAAFDCVFSMGVLYHRRSPLDHLEGVLHMVKPGGTLVIESIVVPGDADTVLCPPDRYARMRNVWFVPSSALIQRWLERLGCEELRIVHEGPTTTAEQRPTDWMRFESLAETLDPEASDRTIEGHPAPRRALITARRRH